MKTLIAALLLALPISLRAQWVVTDPGATMAIVTTRVETLGQMAEEIKKFEDQIDNQLKQINEAKRLFDLQDKVRAEIGDWTSVYNKALSIQADAKAITDDRFDLHVNQLLYIDASSPVSRLRQNNSTVLTAKDVFGNSVQINATRANGLIAAEDTFHRFYDVYHDTEQPITDTRAELAKTYSDMNAPGVTQADYTKLSMKAQALERRLQELNARRTQASQALTAQHIANQTEKDKQDAADEATRTSEYQTLNKSLSDVRYAPFQWR